MARGAKWTGNMVGPARKVFGGRVKRTQEQWRGEDAGGYKAPKVQNYCAECDLEFRTAEALVNHRDIRHTEPL